MHEKMDEEYCNGLICIEIDTEQLEVHLLHRKHEKPTALVKATHALNVVSHRGLETTMGMLMFTSQLLPASQPFLCRLYKSLLSSS
jgi:hypothetical protein